MNFFLRTTIAFFFLRQGAQSLTPDNLPSGKVRTYRFNLERPEADLKVIDSRQASFLSKHWLNIILQPHSICKEDLFIIDNINRLENFIQSQFPEQHEHDVEYLAWIPRGIAPDILFLFVSRTVGETNVLLLLVNSPFWDSNQIKSDYLLESLQAYSDKNNKTLDIDHFLSKNVRYKSITVF